MPAIKECYAHYICVMLFFCICGLNTGSVVFTCGTFVKVTHFSMLVSQCITDMPTYHSTVLFVFVVIFYGQSMQSPSNDKDFTLVQVIYSRNPVRSTAGQTLTLKCTVKYTKEQCGSPLASWCLPKEHCQLLADSDRYLIYTNETEIETGFRQRDVFITFKQLSVNDTEFYNCMAKCLKTGASAVGHRINLTITAEEPNKSVRRHADMVLLMLSGFLLPLLH
ncbi:uncharacterized protein zgc:174945 [Electrophorus electricus]|uniref:uncharacterized protein zgc:174945 n=1 Tax=Electrophorus electricus TaxID=8005 RepID=UPI0015D03690|nr:uncharacterized protein zgc:174945 [Electrophorus electricus]